MFPYNLLPDFTSCGSHLRICQTHKTNHIKKAIQRFCMALGLAHTRRVSFIAISVFSGRYFMATHP